MVERLEVTWRECILVAQVSPSCHSIHVNLCGERNACSCAQMSRASWIEVSLSSSFASRSWKWLSVARDLFHLLSWERQRRLHHLVQCTLFLPRWSSPRLLRLVNFSSSSPFSFDSLIDITLFGILMPFSRHINLISLAVLHDFYNHKLERLWKLRPVDFSLMNSYRVGYCNSLEVGTATADLVKVGLISWIGSIFLRPCVVELYFIHWNRCCVPRKIISWLYALLTGPWVIRLNPQPRTFSYCNAFKLATIKCFVIFMNRITFKYRPYRLMMTAFYFKFNILLHSWKKWDIPFVSLYSNFDPCILSAIRIIVVHRLNPNRALIFVEPKDERILS